MDHRTATSTIPLYIFNNSRPEIPRGPLIKEELRSGMGLIVPIQPDMDRGIPTTTFFNQVAKFTSTPNHQYQTSAKDQVIKYTKSQSMTWNTRKSPAHKPQHRTWKRGSKNRNYAHQKRNHERRTCCKTHNLLGNLILKWAKPNQIQLIGNIMYTDSHPPLKPLPTKSGG